MKQENFINNKKQKFKNEIGITLIALVVTIVVLLILAGITINLLFSNGGIFKTAEDAADAWNDAVTNEQASLDNLADQINNLVNGTNTQTGPVTNPYGEDWDYAWVCNDGVWDNTQYTAGNEIEGDIVAKFYATENQIQPPTLNWEDYEIPFAEGTEYHLVIEGTGDMGQLMQTSGTTINNAYGWQVLSATYFMEYMLTNTMPSSFCIIPYVTEITICDGITNIADCAFAGDTALNKITIGNTVKKLGLGGFLGCEKLTNIIIPSSVTSIGVSAFWGCTSLASITIPSSVTSIESSAFRECTSLANITIPSSVTSIGSYAFRECTSLASITIQNGVTSIENNAFEGCTSLANITIPSSVTSIGSYAFWGCTSLASITIPSSVTSIGSSAFWGCTSLANITYTGKQTEWNNISKDGWSTASSITSITCTDGVITL